MTRKAMIDRDHDLPISRQAKVLNISRGAVYYQPRLVSAEDLKIMRRIDELHLDHPFAGARMLRDMLNREGVPIGRRHVATLMKRGFVYLAAVVDVFSRRVLAHRVSITMETAFCVEALCEALAKRGKPEIFNTDQGSQFTSEAFTGVLIENSVAISMDGKGSWRDNVFVERLWRSVKYEEVYLKAYESVGEARASIARYFAFYNERRPHSALDRKTPDEAYFGSQAMAAAA